MDGDTTADTWDMAFIPGAGRLYLGLGVYTWDWAFIPGTGRSYLGLGVYTWARTLSLKCWRTHLGLGVFCVSGAYSVWMTPCWKLRLVALLIGSGGRVDADDAGPFSSFLLVPGLPSEEENVIFVFIFPCMSH